VITFFPRDCGKYSLFSSERRSDAIGLYIYTIYQCVLPLMVSFRWKLPRHKSYPPRSSSDTLKHTHTLTHNSSYYVLLYVSHEYTTHTDVVIGRGSFIAHVVLMRATSILVIGSFHPILRNLLFVLIKSKRTRCYIASHILLYNISHCQISITIKLSSCYLNYIIYYFLLYLIFFSLHRWSRLREHPNIIF